MQEQHDTCQGEFYTAAAKYWDRIPPTIDGMLGGFGFVSQTDIKGSMVFLKSLFEVCTMITYAATFSERIRCYEYVNLYVLTRINSAKLL